MLSIPINIYIVVGYVLILLVCSHGVWLVCGALQKRLIRYSFEPVTHLKGMFALYKGN